MRFERNVKETFHNMKRFETYKELICIPIVNSEELTIGLLKPICKDYRTLYPGIVSLISKWRTCNPSLSNSIFTVTNERTMNWLDNLVLSKSDRMFFLIDDLNNHHLGHIALSRFNYEEESGFVDSVLRGEPSTVHDLMYYTIMSLQKWMVERLECKRIYLVTNIDNYRAINLYKRCMFDIIKTEPLFKRDLKDEVRWDTDFNRDPAEAEKYEYLMRSNYPEKRGNKNEI